MSFFKTPVRRLAIIRACASLVLAITLGVFALLGEGDATGMALLLILVAVCLICAGASIWQARHASPDEHVTCIPDYAPRDEQILYFRRAWWSTVLGFPVLTAWIAYNLCLLEKGAADSVFVVAPIGLIYERLGFWPAVLTLPAVGILCFVVLSRKLSLLESDGSAWISQAGRR